MMKIGDITFGPYPLFLAPMEDVTDPAFRMLCKQQGADMVTTEFVSSDALIRNVRSTERKLNILKEERPAAIQIYGKDPDTMVEAAKMCEEAQPDVIDINCGCPVKKVAGKGAGAGLLQNIPLMLRIVEAVVKAVHVPVTVKTRLGWNDAAAMPGSGIGITEIAEQLQDCGIAALTIHGRTREQMYRGEADWSLIGTVKENPRIHIPIIGNGDVTTPERARECFERYGVDAVMVGRASVGKPWVFREMRSFLDNGVHAASLTWDEQMALLKQMVYSNVEKLDEYRGILHSRRHLAATPLFKGIPNFRETRIAMLRAATLTELMTILDGINPSDYQR
jgi:nifR3 family TIM-barrel protein